MLILISRHPDLQFFKQEQVLKIKCLNAVDSQLCYGKEFIQELFPLLTQEWDNLQHCTDLLHRTLGQAAFMVVTAKAVDPTQQPASVCFGLSVKFLQQLGGHRKVILKTTYMFQIECVVNT